MQLLEERSSFSVSTRLMPTSNETDKTITELFQLI